MSKGPIKRHETFVPYSREHHHGLLLGWKIRQGFKLGISADRMRKYVIWFWDEHLKFHFEAEEKYLFPILPETDDMIIRALHEHKEIEKLIKSEEGIQANLHTLEKLITEHIRFEERTLFKVLEELANEEQLKHIDDHHNDPFVDDWADEFWVK